MGFFPGTPCPPRTARFPGEGQNSGLPSPAWTYSDWITKESGSADRLSRLRLHIQEVSDFISTGNFTTEGKSIDKDNLQNYLGRLLDLEPGEASASAAASSTSKRAFFTRGRAL